MCELVCIALGTSLCIYMHIHRYSSRVYIHTCVKRYARLRVYTIVRIRVHESSPVCFPCEHVLIGTSVWAWHVNIFANVFFMHTRFARVANVYTLHALIHSLVYDACCVANGFKVDASCRDSTVSESVGGFSSFERWGFAQVLGFRKVAQFDARCNWWSD